MKPGLSHTLTPTGEVRLTLTGPDGGSLCVEVSAAAARARAWGLLADLDPDEAAATIPGGYATLAEFQPAKDRRIGQVNRLLVALRDHGPSTNQRLRLLTDLQPNVIGSRLARAIEMGHVAKLQAVRHGAAVVEITAAGRDYLAARVP